MEILVLRPQMITRKVLNTLLPLGDTKKLSLEDAKAIIEENTQHGIHTYVGYEDGHPVGCVTLVVLKKFIHNGGVGAYLEDLSVIKAKQGLGYGKKLVRHVIKKARAAGCYKVALICKEELEPFYEKCGFTHCGCFMRKLL